MLVFAPVPRLVVAPKHPAKSTPEQTSRTWEPHPQELRELIFQMVAENPTWGLLGFIVNC